jgi:hypothetical protein
MRTLLAVIALSLISVVGASAQSHPVTVSVVPSNTMALSQDIATGLAGRIGATSRYALVTHAAADILVMVDCLPAVVNGKQVATICNTTLSYFPVHGTGLDTQLDGMLVASDEAHVVQSLFDAFVQDTSDEILSAQAAEFKKNLNAVIARNPNGVN